MEQTYDVGSVVWVKITGGRWWPGEVVSTESCPEDVTKGLKKDPLFIVKFFDEDYYELVKNESHIKPFLCSRSAEFVRKGREFLKYDPHLEKFDKDVAEAEQLCGNISDYSMDVQYAESDLDTSAASNHVGSSFSDDKHNHGSALVSSSVLQPKNGSEQMEFNQSFGGDVDVRIRTQLTPGPSSRSMNYLCDVCGFQTSRIANIILHHKSHSELYRHWSGKGSSDLKDRSVFSDGRVPRPKENSKAVQRCKRKLLTNEDKTPRKKKAKKSDVGSVAGTDNSAFDAIANIRSGKAEETKRQKKKKENDSDAVFEKIKRQAMKKMNRKRGGTSFMGTGSLTGVPSMKGLKRDGISDESSDDEEFLIMREDFDSKDDEDEAVEENEVEGETKEADSEPKEVEEKETNADVSDDARLVNEDINVSDVLVETIADVTEDDKTADIEPGVDVEENDVDVPPVDDENVGLSVSVSSFEHEVRTVNDAFKKPADEIVENLVADESEKDGDEKSSIASKTLVTDSCPMTDVEGQLSILLPPVLAGGGQAQTGSDHSYDAKPSTTDEKHDGGVSENDVATTDGEVCVVATDVSQPQVDFTVEECVVEQRDLELPPLPPPLPPSPPPPPPPPPPSVDYIALAEDVIIDPGDIPLPPSEAEPPGREVAEEAVPVLEYTKLETLIQPPDMGSVYLETSMDAPLVEGDEMIHLGNEQVIDSSMDVFCNEIVIESDDKYVQEDYDNICLLAEAERAKTENNSGTAVLVSGAADEQIGKGRISGTPFSSAEDTINGSSLLLESGDGQAQTLARKQAGLGQAR